MGFPGGVPGRRLLIARRARNPLGKSSGLLKTIKKPFVFTAFLSVCCFSGGRLGALSDLSRNYGEAQGGQGSPFSAPDGRFAVFGAPKIV